jgi:protein-L-isoaspartate O-methyltransferase
LGDGGRLVIPVGATVWEQTLWLLVKAGGKLRREFLGEVRFVPLVGSPASAAAEEDVALADIRRELNELFRYSLSDKGWG